MSDRIGVFLHFSEDGWRSFDYPCFSLARKHIPTPWRWRDEEEKWNLRRLILTLFYYSPSLASELSRISMGLHSLSWWKDSCAAERLFTLRPPAPLREGTEYTTRSLLYQAHIRAIKNKSKTEWREPFVNVMFVGAFWNHLLNQEASF